MTRFYTSPPRNSGYPFFMLNPKLVKRLHKEPFEHAILDCGIEIFGRKDVVEYPDDFMAKWKTQARDLTDEFGDRLWVTVPDYCDDLRPGAVKDNHRKTIKRIEEFISVDGVNWLISLQGRYYDYFSFYEAIQLTHDAVGRYPRIAIGTVCKSKRKQHIVQILRAARAHFPDSHIHAFGLTLSYLPDVKNTINSFDSMAWCFPRTKFRKWDNETGYKPLLNTAPYGESEKHTFFFNAYMKRVNEILSDADTPTSS
jgi:hypothetical protein